MKHDAATRRHRRLAKNKATRKANKARLKALPDKLPMTGYVVGPHGPMKHP